jgi:UDP-N-acetylmuramoyl-tripeptide--D-alanyl-D-alanine ligase
MIPLTIAEIANAVGGRMQDVPRPSAVVTGPAAADSRELTPGGLFVAIKGARHDGHDHAEAAIARGSVAILATRPVGHPAIVVPDVLAALGALARVVLGRLEPAVIGITGSVGKTTTKDLLAQILEGSGETIATAKSYNNELGLPLTVLRADRQTRYLILEMGVGRKGDITYLTGLARPQIGVVLNVGASNLESLGSLDGVAAAKGELVEALPGADHGGVAILNSDDPRVAAMTSRTRARILRFGRAGDAAIRADDVAMDQAARASFTLRTPAGTAPVRLRLPGEHQIGNALAAAAVAFTLGIATGQAAQALSEATRRTPARFELLEGPAGVTVVNDAFNANPESMRAGLRTLKAMAAGRRTIAVLGEMLDQGEASESHHEDIGRLAAELGVSIIITVGRGDAMAMATAARLTSRLGRSQVAIVPDPSTALSLLRGLLRADDIVLVKASNGVGLAGLATQLCERAEC